METVTQGMQWLEGLTGWNFALAFFAILSVFGFIHLILEAPAPTREPSLFRKIENFLVRHGFLLPKP